MLMMGLRLGDDPRVVVGTTPKPLPLIRELLQDPTTSVSRGSSYENRENLAEAWYSKIITKYEGTRLGRQELEAEMLEDMPGALWTLTMLDELRRLSPPGSGPLWVPCDMQRILIAIDPAGSTNPDSDETGIGAAARGVDGHGYVLEDASCRMLPLGWAQRAVNLYYKWRADAIVAEKNFGGDMVESTIRTVDPNVRVIMVTASRGKAVRAEPVSALYEQGRAHHVGTFKELEEQMCAFSPSGYGLKGSPDRVDWMVWAMTELFENDTQLGFVGYLKAEQKKADEKTVREAAGIPEPVPDPAPRPVAKIEVAQEIKPTIATNSEACPECGSVAIVRIPGGKRCNQCGAQFGGNTVVQKPSGRKEMLAK